METPRTAEADATADISFLTEAEGGRWKSIAGATAYHPQFFYEGRDWDVRLEFPEVDHVAPGATVRALLRFLSPQEHLGKVVSGLEFELREGQRTVARGIITDIVGLEDSAKRLSARRGGNR